MRIKFKAPDPRAGTTAQMDSSRGQHFVDSGSAVVVKDGGDEPAASEASADTPAPAKPVAKKAASKKA